MNKKLVIGNLIIAMLAQGISLFLSFLTSFIVPKMLNVEMFSFWQLFIFYITYVGIFHFGINDGVYLKYGGKNLEEMDKELVSGQFKCLVIIQCFIVTIMTIGISATDIDKNRKFVLIFVLVYMLIFNLSNYLSYIFQAANLTRIYSYSVILDKVFFMVGIVVLLFIKSQTFHPYIIFYLSGKLICLFFCLVKGKQMVFYKTKNWKRITIELKDSIKIGIKLTISSMSSMLILGVGRFMIDFHWGIMVFGKISFALSLTTFVLAFVQQISMVFFPVLRRVDDKHQLYVYEMMRYFCFFGMPFIYFIMIPGKILITAWIPQYTDSIYYLGILLPICIFDAKMNMVFNTFFKVLRLEKKLLWINIGTFIISCVLGIIGTYLLDSYWFVIVCMVVAVAFRSVYSEVVLNNFLYIKTDTKCIYEIILAAIYMFISYIEFSYIVTFMVLVIVYVGECFCYRKELQQFIDCIHKLLSKEQ